jgi:hypothetical protein
MLLASAAHLIQATNVSDINASVVNASFDVGINQNSIFANPTTPIVTLTSRRANTAALSSTQATNATNNTKKIDCCSDLSCSDNSICSCCSDQSCSDMTKCSSCCPEDCSDTSICLPTCCSDKSCSDITQCLPSCCNTQSCVDMTICLLHGYELFRFFSLLCSDPCDSLRSKPSAEYCSTTVCHISSVRGRLAVSGRHGGNHGQIS